MATSTKADVLAATVQARATRGRVWVYDPSLQFPNAAPGVNVLQWSPVRAGRAWDVTLQTAFAMVDASFSAGRPPDPHWGERAGTLLAALLHAAALEQLPLGAVRRWVLTGDLDSALAILEGHTDRMAMDVLRGLLRTSERELSGIISTAANVLSAYNSSSVLESTQCPNFDPHQFVRSSDTLYVLSPSHMQERLAPLVVGLLEEIRDASFMRERSQPRQFHNVMWALDEVTKIAPLRSLPDIVSEAGSQGLHVIACLQDLSQARARWGEAARGFLTLFSIKVIFPGIGDLETLTNLSQIMGVKRSSYPSETTSRDAAGNVTISRSQSWVPEPVMDVGAIASLQQGTALVAMGATFWFVRLTPLHSSKAWWRVASGGKDT
ncbi:hypothetical protein PDTK01_30790 [Phycicoccus sp. DTK01]|nr:hypothetical protein PDTK01_30790 [Phycicoccus sp. DTK01]